MARILIVDDIPANRDLLVTLLGHAGHETFEAVDGADALVRARAERPDLVISDILMPTMDGFEFVRALRADPELAGTNVIFHTAHFREVEARHLAGACGVTRIMLKPSDPEDMLATIQSALADATAASPIDGRSGGAAPNGEDGSLDGFDRLHLRLVTDKLAASEMTLRATNHRLSALTELNVELASKQDPRALLDSLCRNSRELVGARYGVLCARDRRHSREPLVFTCGLAQTLTARLPPPMLDGGMLGAMLHERSTLNRTGLGGDPTSAGLPPGYPPAHSMLAAPVCSLKHAYGWICLVDKVGADAFDADDERILSVLAAQVGRIYENGSLYAELALHARALEGEIDERRRVEHALRESERRFSATLANLELIALMLDADGRVTYANDYLLHLLERGRDEIIGADWIGIALPPDIAGPVSKVRHSLLADAPSAHHFDNEILTARGERRLIHWNNTVLRAPGGEVTGTASIGEDITDRKRAEDRIQRLNRVHAMLSGINSIIVREEDREQLLQEVCRIAVAQGGFRLAWVGAIDQHSGHGIVFAGFGGSAGSIARVRFGETDDLHAANHPAMRALRDMRPVICNDAEADADVAPWREELLDPDDRSFGCFPLVFGGHPLAVLTLVAAKPGVFDAEELGLLRELSHNIAFALDHIQQNQRLDYLAYYDSVTGLPNRKLFADRLNQSIRAAERERVQLGVFVLDLQRFRGVNDALGRGGGDALLQTIAQRGVERLGDASLFGRLVSDQFAFVVPSLKVEDDAVRIIEEWDQAVFGSPLRSGDAEFRLAARYGIALYPHDGGDAETLLKNAEEAMRRAKVGTERYLFYTRQMAERIAERLSLDGRLHNAIENDEFLLHYQPKVDLETGAIAGVEALIRWNSPSGLVPPLEFIPFMEETGMILDVGKWVMERAVRDYRAWRDAGLPAPKIAVNVSAVQMRQRNFVDTVRRALGEPHGDVPLDLELTESLIMEDIAGSIAKLDAVRKLGVNVAIDDFGTGYSSLAYLVKLPAQSLKIDHSFIAAMLDEPDTMALVATIISLAHSLRLKVVAEGVESVEQARMLRLLRCDEMQGFLYSRPVPFDDISALLARGGASSTPWR